MPSTMPQLKYQNSYEEIVETITDGIEVGAGSGIGTFDPETLGFSVVENVVGDETFAYVRYTGISTLALNALIKEFPKRIVTEDGQTWITDGDARALIDGVLRHLRGTGLLNPSQELK